MKSISTTAGTGIVASACLLAATGLVMSTGAQAQEITDPVPIATMGRHMPGFGNEAIVKARYTVKADGSTDDVQIFSYLSNQFLNNMLRDYVRDWTFEPATVDGTPVDVYNQEWIFAMRVDPNAPPPEPGAFGPGGPPPGSGDAEGGDTPAFDFSNMPHIPLALSPDVKEAVDEISALVGAEDYEQALKEVDKVQRRSIRTVFDYALAYELRTSILMAMEQPFAALEASKLATMTALHPDGETMFFLEDQVLESALKKKVLLAATLRQQALAWEAYQQLTSQFEVPASDAIHKAAESAKAALDSPDPLPLITKIVDNEWTFEPSRRIFTVTNVEGRLNRIEARCERNNLELDYEENVDWTLPESLGKCVLDFKGRDDTEFVVYEFAE